MEIIVTLIIIVAVVFIIRLFGAWMLRIDEVITNQKAILAELKRSLLLIVIVHDSNCS